MTFGSSLKKAFQSATKWVEVTAKTVYGTAKPVVNTVYGDAKSVVSFAGNQLAKNADTGRNLVGTLGNSAGNLVNDVGSGVKDLSSGIANALPTIALAAGGLAAVFLMTNGGGKRSGQFSRSSSKRARYTYGL